MIAILTAALTFTYLPPTVPTAKVDTVVAILNSRLRSDPHNACLQWAARAYCDGQPGWKRKCAANVAYGRVSRFVAHPTAYYPGDAAVDRLGGGMYPAWNIGRKLRRGDLAADRRRYPMGTVLVLAATGESGIVVDVGVAIRGRDVDVCRTDEREYRRDAARFRDGDAWVVGRVTRKEATR